MDTEKAVKFIKDSGDRVLISLAEYAVGQKDKDEVLATISKYQLADGGWTGTDKDFTGELSVISTTWYGLQWLIWLEAGDSRELEDTVAFLAEAQRSGGYWDEPEEILEYDPSPWMLPGQYENKLWLTSAVGSKLKELGRLEDIDQEAAFSFIAAGWDGERLPGFNHTHWMCIYLFFDIPEYINIAAGCKKFLLQAIEQDEVDSGDYCAVAYHSYNTGKFARGLYELSLEKLMSFQADDGGMITEYGDKHRPVFTVETLFLLRKIGKLIY